MAIGRMNTIGGKPSSTRKFAAESWGICVLAGGLSTRMGRDKSRLRVGARTILGEMRRVAATLGVGMRVIRRDLSPRCGPLGGVFTALKSSEHEVELFVPCDMPFLSAGLLRRVRRALRKGEMAVFSTQAGRSGFPFALRRESISVVEEQMRRGEFSLQELAHALRARRIEFNARAAQELFNVNTPEELAAARGRMKKPAGLRA